MLIVGAAGGVGSFLTQLAAQAGAHVDAVAPAAEAGRMTGYGAAETIDRAAMPLPDAVARTHPDGIDVLVDVASDAAQFAALAGHVRPGGTALTTRYVADPQTLARAGVTGVNFALLHDGAAAGPAGVAGRRRVHRPAADHPGQPGRRPRRAGPPARKGKPSSRCRPGRA